MKKYHDFTVVYCSNTMVYRSIFNTMVILQPSGQKAPQFQPLGFNLPTRSSHAPSIHSGLRLNKYIFCYEVTGITLLKKACYRSIQLQTQIFTEWVLFKSVDTCRPIKHATFTTRNLYTSTIWVEHQSVQCSESCASCGRHFRNSNFRFQGDRKLHGKCISHQILSTAFRDGFRQ